MASPRSNASRTLEMGRERRTFVERGPAETPGGGGDLRKPEALSGSKESTDLPRGLDERIGNAPPGRGCRRWRSRSVHGGRLAVVLTPSATCCRAATPTAGTAPEQWSPTHFRMHSQLWGAMPTAARLHIFSLVGVTLRTSREGGGRKSSICLTIRAEIDVASWRGNTVLTGGYSHEPRKKRARERASPSRGGITPTSRRPVWFPPGPRHVSLGSGRPSPSSPLMGTGHRDLL